MTIGAKQRASLFPCGLGGVTGCIPGFAALPAQCTQGIAQQRAFLVFQALYRLWLGQDFSLQISYNRLTTLTGGGSGCASFAMRTAFPAMRLFDCSGLGPSLAVEQ